MASVLACAAPKLKGLACSASFESWVRHHFRELSDHYRDRRAVINALRSLHTSWSRAGTPLAKWEAARNLVEYTQSLKYPNRQNLLLEFVAFLRYLV